ncbi:MAG: hypothetical protein DCC71_13475 [Proteobacteria bacterium]|nr:MAG: hypothetical protein DCC71_13475 [Pseudomonadota bacterium]
MSSRDSDPVRAFLGPLREAVVKPMEIARALDDMTHAERVSAIRAAGRAEQKRLYDAVAAQRELRMTDMVPAAVAAMRPVRHYGKNTLPAFTHFEKRFCRPEDADAAAPAQLWGYNEGSMRWLTGPGYFVLRGDPERGELLVDYNLVPPAHPPEWPALRRNEQGLSRFVYGFMIDRLRGVSQHVTVGSAARKGKDLGSWFLLCREA